MTGKTDDDFEYLPGILAEIARVAGLRAALALAAAAGGTDIYVPRRPRRGKLVEAVGMAAADKIAKLYGAENILVPLGPVASDKRKRAEIARMLRDQVPLQEIARSMGVHVRTIQRNKHRVSNHLPLFPDLD